MFKRLLLVVILLAVPFVSASVERTSEQVAVDFVSNYGIFTVGHIPVNNLAINVLALFEYGDADLVIVQVEKDYKKAKLLVVVKNAQVQNLILLTDKEIPTDENVF